MRSGSASWPEVSLGEVCELKYGKSLPDAKRVGGDIPVFGSNGVVGSHNQALTEGPAIIVGRKGSFGEVNLSPVPCWPIDTTYYVDRSSTRADLRWLAHRLSRLGLTRLNKAAAVPGLNREDAYRQRLLLPPLAEQRRIAEVLDRAEALRAKRRATLAQLDTLTQSLFLDLFGDPATNPKGWAATTLGDLCEEVIDCPHSTPIYADQRTPYPCVRSSDIQNGDLDFTNVKFVQEPEYEKRILRGKPKRGDVIYCREGARFGNAARILDDTPLCLGQRMMVFRPRTAATVSEYLWAFLSGPAGYGEATRSVDGSAAPHVNIRDIVAFRLPAPPVALQRDFARRIGAVEKLKTAHRASLAEMDVLFASLRHRAFRGEL